MLSGSSLKATAKEKREFLSEQILIPVIQSLVYLLFLIPF
jgi:hypothetical protein